MVEVAVTLGPHGTDQLGRQGAERDGDITLAGRGGDDAHVLVMQVDPESGLEVTRKHAGGLSLQDSVPRQPTGQYGDGSLGINTVGPQEDDRLGHQLDGARDNQRVRGLRISLIRGATSTTLSASVQN